MSRGSLVGIATGYGLNYRGFGVRDPIESTNFNFFILFRPALGSTQPPTQWAAGYSGRSVKLSRGEENVDLYFHSHIRLHGVVPK
jgi:hypothetical protein